MRKVIEDIYIYNVYIFKASNASEFNKEESKLFIITAATADRLTHLPLPIPKPQLDHLPTHSLINLFTHTLLFPPPLPPISILSSSHPQFKKYIQTQRISTEPR